MAEPLGPAGGLGLPPPGAAVPGMALDGGANRLRRGRLASGRAALERFYRWSDGVKVHRCPGCPDRQVMGGRVLAVDATDGCSNRLTEAINLLVRSSR